MNDTSCVHIVSILHKRRMPNETNNCVKSPSDFGSLFRIFYIQCSLKTVLTVLAIWISLLYDHFGFERKKKPSHRQTKPSREPKSQQQRLSTLSMSSLPFAISWILWNNFPPCHLCVHGDFDFLNPDTILIRYSQKLNFCCVMRIFEGTFFRIRKADFESDWLIN